MEAMPKITVVTVTRNAEKTLEETILSVVGQTYANVEYIVVDGGSTDGTLDIVRKYGKHIDRWVSEPDRGIYDAMNKGVNLASGEIILFLNAGDSLYAGNTIEKVVACGLERDFTVGVARYSCMRYWIPVREDFTLRDVIAGGAVNHQSCFIKTEILKNTPYNLDYRITADDYYFVEQVLFCGRSYKRLPLIVSNYNAHGVSNDPRHDEEKMRERKAYYQSRLPERVLCDYSSILCRSHTRKRNPARVVRRLVDNLKTYLLQECRLLPSRHALPHERGSKA